MTTTVYLNEGDNMFRPFDENRSALRKAIEFDSTDGLDRIFEQLNIGGDMVPAQPYTTEYRTAGNRSLSVGDVVALGTGEAFAVDMIGWTPITDAAVLAANQRYERNPQ